MPGRRSRAKASIEKEPNAANSEAWGFSKATEQIAKSAGMTMAGLAAFRSAARPGSRTVSFIRRDRTFQGDLRLSARGRERPTLRLVRPQAGP